MIHTIINKIREITPLSLRKKVGPVLAYFVYVYRVYIKKVKAPHVLSIEETIDVVIKENLSMIRFGDGELSVIDNLNIPFQNHSQELANKLLAILQTNEKGLLICVPGFFGKMTIFVKEAFLFNLHHLFKHGHVWERILSPTQRYGNTFVGRAFIYLKDRSRSRIIFNKVRSLWEGKDIVMIEGEKSKNGLGNDLFSNAKSVTRIACPNKNAFESYKTIRDEALKMSKDKLILLALGPAAKVLAYELFHEGYRVIDIGHLDMEYEMFVRGDENAHKKRLVHEELKA